MTDVNTLPEGMRRFNVGTLILTYTCPLACRMCFFECSPRRAETLDQTLARNFIDDLATLGVPHVGFAGGEPILRLDFLCQLIERSKFLGLIPIVISSGYWGKTEKQAIKVVEKLRSAGLDRIQLSLDDDHLEFIEIEDYARALAACEAAGFDDIKIVGTSKGNKGNFADLVFYVEKVLGVSSHNMDLVDRYRISHPACESEQKTFSLSHLETNVGKPACLSELMLDVNGDIYPCCQNFVGRVGNLYEDGLIACLHRAAEHQEYIRFQNEGPINYARFLDQACGTEFSSKTYSSWCEVCSRVFSDPRFEDRLNPSLSRHRNIADLSGVRISPA